MGGCRPSNDNRCVAFVRGGGGGSRRQGRTSGSWSGRRCCRRCRGRACHLRFRTQRCLCGCNYVWEQRQTVVSAVRFGEVKGKAARLRLGSLGATVRRKANTVACSVQAAITALWTVVHVLRRATSLSADLTDLGRCEVIIMIGRQLRSIRRVTAAWVAWGLGAATVRHGGRHVLREIIKSGNPGPGSTFWLGS